MLHLVRGACDELASGLNDPLKMFENPGPLYLLVNALAITAVTYFTSFRLLNVARAAKEYDLRVPAIHASPDESGGSKCGRLTKAHKIVAAIVMLASTGLFWGTALTLQNPTSRTIFSIMTRMMWTWLSFMGFSVLYILSRPPLPEASFFRVACRGYAIPFIAPPKRGLALRDRLAILPIMAAAVYTSNYPNIWLTGFAAMGLGVVRICWPHGHAHTVSIRGVMIYISMSMTAAAIAVALVVSIPWPRQSEEDKAKNSGIDFRSILDPVWFNFGLQYAGFIVGGLLTALVLRYEHSISNAVFDLPTSDNKEATPLNQAEGGLPVVSYSTKDAVTTRVPIPRNRPQFAKPLFYILITAIFLVHVPGIFLSALLVWKPDSFDSINYPMLSHAVKMNVVLPSQIRTIVLHPFLVGIACLVRKDGGALWRYHEEVVKPLVPAPAPIAEEAAQFPNATEEKAASQFRE